MRYEKSFSVEITSDFKKKISQWADNQAVEMIWLDTNSYPDKYGKYDAILAFSAENKLTQLTDNQAFTNLKNFIDTQKDWLFGYLSYDLKNDIENLTSKNADFLHFPEIFFFQPQKIIFLKGNKLIFSYLEHKKSEIDTDFTSICNFIPLKTEKNTKKIKNEVKKRISKEKYIEKVEKMKEFIAKGDIYEANFCQEFFLEDVTLSPIEAFWELNEISTPPFASFLKFNEFSVMSASPERYLQLIDNQAITQPIKGTAKRSEIALTDQKLKNELAQNPKERTENIMITDLVRNDLSLYAEKGSVQVAELCQPYTFKQVHQLISTVKATLKPQTHAVDLIKSTFPMGSMTGAPKISAMKIIEALEESKRSIYSGAIGYFSPENNFDFNVVIRSIFYNSVKKYASFSVGSAITANSSAENEYEECLIKANAMKNILENFS